MSATEAAQQKAKDASGIRPFEVSFADSDLIELRRRIDATRWPDRETVGDDSQGVPLATMQELARHWATSYDWRKCEAKLNALPQFVTEIDGLDIHFIHVRSKHEHALPLIVTHGWPGSVIEMLKIIEPLADPTAHGGTAADAFHLVIPSLPGYGFSGKPTKSGWDLPRIGKAWVTLMKRLGYSQFVAQGGDWGGSLCDVMAEQAPPELLGIHSNFPGTVPSGPPASDLSPEEKRAYQQLTRLRSGHNAYGLIMGTRPQTMCALVDSPVGLAAWLLDHGDGSGQPGLVEKAVLGSPPGDVTLDDVLDNITLYWLTGTGVSSSRLYWENKRPFLAAGNVSTPAAVSVFPEEFYQAPRSWAEHAYHNLIYFNEVEKGGHFAAWEQPQLFSEELRAGLTSLR